MSGGVINRSSFAKLLWPGLNKIYGEAYAKHPVEWKMLGFKQERSSQAYEEDLGVSMFGLAEEKGEGDSVTYDSARQTYRTRYVHVVYGKGFMVTREQYDDNLYPQLGLKKAQALSFGMNQTKEINGANIFNRAFSASYVGGDGVALLSTSHPHFYQTAGSSTTWKNRPTTDADLSETSLEQACIDIGNWTDDRGLRIAVQPTKLIVPIQLQFQAQRLLKTEKRVATADNDISAIVSMGKFSDGFAVNHYLTDVNAWFLNTTAPNSLCVYQRRGMEFTIDNDFDTENAKFKATERYVFGWTDPRGLYGTAGE